MVSPSHVVFYRRKIYASLRALFLFLPLFSLLIHLRPSLPSLSLLFFFSSSFLIPSSPLLTPTPPPPLLFSTIPYLFLSSSSSISSFILGCFVSSCLVFLVSFPSVRLWLDPDVILPPIISPPKE